MLLGDRLDNLPEALSLARRTPVKVRQNLFWAFGYNLIVLPVAAGALSQPWGAAVAPRAALPMALSSITVGSMPWLFGCHDRCFIVRGHRWCARPRSSSIC